MGFFDSFSPEKWRQLAVALGFAPFQPIELYAEAMCFRRMQRVRGQRADAAASNYSQWLWGHWRGAEVVVIQYETGSGSNSVTWTSAIARIAPPLWLGLEVSSENVLSRLFGGTDVSLGHTAYDNAFKINAIDRERAVMLLSPADADGMNMLNRMLGVFQAYVGRVTDSYVEVKRSGVHTDPAYVAAMLDSAVELAGWLRFRRNALPSSQWEQAQHFEWQRFADANRFAFDSAYMAVSGMRDSVQIDISVEMEGQRPHTVVNVRFPRSGPYDVFVSRTNVPGFLQGILSQDIQVGDAFFDESFKVQGRDETGIRQWLARPTLLRALGDAVRFANDLRIDRHGLFMRFPSAVPTAANLEWYVGWSCVVSRELVGASAAEQGPYR